MTEIPEHLLKRAQEAKAKAAAKKGGGAPSDEAGAPTQASETTPGDGPEGAAAGGGGVATQERAPATTTTAQTASIQAVGSGINTTTSVTFVAGGAYASLSSLTANPSAVHADGSAASTVTFTANDAFNNPIAALPVTLSQAGNATFAATTGQTGLDGTFSTTIVSTTAARRFDQPAQPRDIGARICRAGRRQRVRHGDAVEHAPAGAAEPQRRRHVERVESACAHESQRVALEARPQRGEHGADAGDGDCRRGVEGCRGAVGVVSADLEPERGDRDGKGNAPVHGTNV